MILSILLSTLVCGFIDYNLNNRFKIHKDDINKIIDIPLGELRDRMLEMGYKIKISSKLKNHLVEAGYDEKYGARPLNRAIQRYVEDPIAERMLDGDLKEGDTIKIGYSKGDVTVDIDSVK